MSSVPLNARKLKDFFQFYYKTIYFYFYTVNTEDTGIFFFISKNQPKHIQLTSRNIHRTRIIYLYFIEHLRALSVILMWHIEVCRNIYGISEIKNVFKDFWVVKNFYGILNFFQRLFLSLLI